VDPGQYKPGAPKSSFIPALCEVCRNRPVAMIVVDFIFACNQCAKRIEAAIWHRRDERLLARSSVSSTRLGSDTRRTGLTFHRRK
jgi:hypothetical protein